MKNELEVARSRILEEERVFQGEGYVVPSRSELQRRLKDQVSTLTPMIWLQIIWYAYLIWKELRKWQR